MLHGWRVCARGWITGCAERLLQHDPTQLAFIIGVDGIRQLSRGKVLKSHPRELADSVRTDPA